MLTGKPNVTRITTTPIAARAPKSTNVPLSTNLAIDVLIAKIDHVTKTKLIAISQSAAPARLILRRHPVIVFIASPEKPWRHIQFRAAAVAAVPDNRASSIYGHIVRRSQHTPQPFSASAEMFSTMASCRLPWRLHNQASIRQMIFASDPLPRHIGLAMLRQRHL